MNIGHVHQWARENVAAPDIVGMVAEFVLLCLESPQLPADTLAAIQRHLKPLDDVGTVREINRQHVELLLSEVVRARADALRAVPAPEEQVEADEDSEEPVLV